MNEFLPQNFPELEQALLERLEKILPIRIVLRRYADGRLQGRTEESFYMNWSNDRVRIFWSGTAHSFLGQFQLDGIEDANNNCSVQEFDLFTPEQLVLDPFSSDCPITIDWKRWLAANTKYDRRNAYFSLKGANK